MDEGGRVSVAARLFVVADAALLLMLVHVRPVFEVARFPPPPSHVSSS